MPTQAPKIMLLYTFIYLNIKDVMVQERHQVIISPGGSSLNKHNKVPFQSVLGFMSTKMHCGSS